jgi:hypothetical protein
MDIECPKCGYINEGVGESLPDNACDDAPFECRSCDHEFLIGWSAEVELR